MHNVIIATKDFTVGDIFINSKSVICYIANIYQNKKGDRYQYQMKYFKDVPYYARKDMDVVSIKDKMIYYGWKHISVKK